MTSQASNLRGIAFMVLATGFFSLNDALMKLATVGLPPFEVLCLRGVMASLWALPVILLTGNGKQVRHVFDKWVLIRNGFELFAVLCFVVALANMPIADVTALGQIAPMLLLLGVALLYRDRIGVPRMVLIALGFLGALLVAQPGAHGVSVYAVLGILCAVGSAARDIAGRKVSAAIPTLVVVFGTLLTVMAGAGVATLLFERFVMPDTWHLLLLAGSGFLLGLGHLFIFMSYRTGATAVVAPFYYMFAIWAVGTGAFIFGTLPNALALAGIALILVSGITIVLMDERRRRLAVELDPVA
ncbi:MAG: DMT family transporter [Devosia nanyangense]|uniref:DMT family transporter n=1 Tax=Devosia nanyangense TaxID=1228055 RepID=A0A933L2N5_9HYPH|nr:DMT family transporter [Devosia nanyangense]